VFSIEDVTARGMCVGCGGCGVATDGRIPITFVGSIGMWQADLDAVSAADREIASQVCPFSDDSPSEDELDAPTAATTNMPQGPRVGRYSTVAAGRRRDDDRAMESSSGGLTSWIVEQLVERGEVDAVINVGPGSGGRLFDFEVTDGRVDKKSQYHSVTFNGVLRDIRGDGRRYVFVGVPCYVKAARTLAQRDEVLAEQLLFYVGLVCGHMKSSFFAESLAWQVGVGPSELEAVDFRLKNRDRPSNAYDFGARAEGDEDWRRSRTGALIGGEWGHAAFQPEACNFCDDIFAETADVVLGDAWLSEYMDDWRGTNLVISRNPLIDELLASPQAEADLELDPLTVDRACASQAGNFRHRRDGMQVRLADDIAAGLPVPAKRFPPRLDHVSSHRKDLIRKRREISRESNRLFSDARTTGRLDDYLVPMRRMIDEYRLMDRKTLAERLRDRASRAKQRIRRLRR
jgi:coenzyme F420 hydrogenase subunit beta